LDRTAAHTANSRTLMKCE